VAAARGEVVLRGAGCYRAPFVRESGGRIHGAWSFPKTGTHPASSAGQAFSGSCS